MHRLAFVASEAAPFSKTGGLADVAGSLPKALLNSGLDVRVFLPLHPSLSHTHRNALTFLGSTEVSMGWRRQYVGVFKLDHNGLTHYFIDNEFYFKRHHLYGEGDDAERYIYFSKAVLAAFKMLDFKPDIVHTNDWHTAAINLLIHHYAYYDVFFKDVKTVFTIHNLRYQGVFDPFVLGDLLDLPHDYFNDDALKFHSSINLLKAGIVFSDHVTTVSKSYAHEIAYPYFGENLEGVVRKYQDKLTGIVNGIDYDVFNPETDSKIPQTFGLKTLNQKIDNKMHLQIKYGLPVDPNIPMLAIVSRLVDMKGLDLIAHILDELLLENVQLVVLGTGDTKYEDLFRTYQYRYPHKVSAHIYFDTDESHAIYAGSDIFLMPSLFEPCGLSQLIALRYGTIPIVRQIGGLKDTVIPYNKYTGEGNGFGFLNYNAHELLFTIKEALTQYQIPEVWRGLMTHAMKADHSWTVSSTAYLNIYKALLQGEKR